MSFRSASTIRNVMPEIEVKSAFKFRREWLLSDRLVDNTNVIVDRQAWIFCVIMLMGSYILVAG